MVGALPPVLDQRLDALPDDLADQWRAGEVPAEVQEFMNPVAATLDQVDRLAAAVGTG